jgi:hypothetical protein
MKVPALNAHRLADAVAKYFAEFEDAPFEEQRTILRTAFKQFKVEKGAITAARMDGGFVGSTDGAKRSPPSR